METRTPSRRPSMKAVAVAAAILLFTASSLPASPEDGPFPSDAASLPSEASQAELDQLLAPIALYPDALLGQVLAASTYPLEVVALQRWLERNPNLPADALEQAVAAQPWDESVKALAPMRSVVAMMNGELEWMQRLGNAFLNREPEVMDAVQRLRREASAAGSLADNARERVIDDGGQVVIEPAEPDVVYVPVYDPRVVYGPWLWPDYPPYAWGVAYFGPWDFVAGGLAFGIGVRLGHSWFDHPRPDWRNRTLLARGSGPPVLWRHDPVHRGGVPYTNPVTRERFGAIDRDRVRQRQDFRGFDVPARPAATPAPRPTNPVARAAPQGSVRMPSRAPQSAGPSPFAPVPRDSARQHSERGRESLASPRPSPARPAPANRPQEHR